jgi:hypothetical protein
MERSGRFSSEIEYYENECEKAKLIGPSQVEKIFHQFFDSTFKQFAILSKNQLSVMKDLGYTLKKYNSRVLHLLSFMMSNSFPSHWPPLYLSFCWEFVLNFNGCIEYKGEDDE